MPVKLRFGHPRLLVLVCGVGFPGTLMAEAVPSGPMVLSPVVVTATRLEQDLTLIPAAVSVVEGATLQRARRQLTLDESLAGVPGLFAQNRSNFAQDTRISIRGFGARSTFGIRGIQLLVDGFPATLPDGQTEVDALDFGVLDRVEVLRGPAGSLYGSAPGGVIQLASETPGGPPFAEVRGALGQDGYRQIQGKAGGDAGPLAYLANVTHQRLDGYRDRSATERSLFTGLAALPLGTGELTARLALVDSPRADDPGALTAAEVALDRRQAAPASRRFQTGESVRQQQLGLSFRQPLAEADELRLRVSGTWRDFANRLPFSAVAIERQVGGLAAEYTHAGALAGWPYRVLLGGDYGRQDDRRRRRRNLDGALGALLAEQQERIESEAVFVQWEQALTDTLDLSLGLRRDRVRYRVTDRFLADGDDSGRFHFSATSPSIGLLWQFAPAHSLYLRGASAFETPTSAELADPRGAGGFNQDLEPETARLLELGARGRPGEGWGYEVALFRTRIEDQLVPVPIVGAPDRFAFENAGRSRQRGLELALEAPLSDRLRGRLAYTYLDYRHGRFTDAGGADYGGRRLPGVPARVLDLRLEYEAPNGLFATWETRHVGPVYADNANTVKTDAYTVTDLSVGRRWRAGTIELEPFLAVDNAFDARYAGNLRINAAAGRYFEPAPERSIHAGIRVRLP